MPHGAINLNQAFDDDYTVTYIPSGGVPKTSTSRRLSLTNVHTRPNNLLNPVDASGWRAPSSFFHRRTVVRYGYVETIWRAMGNQAYTWGPGQFTHSSNFMNAFAFPLILEDRAVNDALNKLYDGQSGWSENFATWQDFIDMTAGKKEAIANSVKAFKRASPSLWRLVKLGRYIPEAWLELQYGWNPLLADVKDGARVIAQRLTDNSGRRHVTSRKTESSSRSVSGDALTTRGDVYPAVTALSERYSSVVRFDFAIGNSSLYAAGQLNLDNPADLAWNLLPFSFVVDWFFPVDSFLTALAAPWGLHFIGGSITRYRNCSARVISAGPSTDGYGTITGAFPLRTVFDVTRTALEDFPGPRVPHFKNPLSLGHYANATSLLASAFR